MEQLHIFAVKYFEVIITKYCKGFILIILVMLISISSSPNKTQLIVQNESAASHQLNGTNDIYQEYDMRELCRHIPKSGNSNEIIDIHTMFLRDLYITVMEAAREINENINIERVRVFVNSENTKMIMSYQNDYGYSDNAKLIKYDNLSDEDKKLYTNNGEIRPIYNRWVIVKKSFYDSVGLSYEMLVNKYQNLLPL